MKQERKCSNKYKRFSMDNNTWDWEWPGKGCAWSSTQGISAGQGRAQNQCWPGKGWEGDAGLSSQGEAKTEKVLESKWLWSIFASAEVFLRQVTCVRKAIFLYLFYVVSGCIQPLNYAHTHSSAHNTAVSPGNAQPGEHLQISWKKAVKTCRVSFLPLHPL